MVCALKAQLANCEMEASALAKEILASYTPGTRRCEAKIRRAKLQTRSVTLEHELDSLVAGCIEDFVPFTR
jgi:hypothetical protein